MTLEELIPISEETVIVNPYGTSATVYRYGVEWDSRFWALQDYEVTPSSSKNSHTIFLRKRAQAIPTKQMRCFLCDRESGYPILDDPGIYYAHCDRHLEGVLDHLSHLE